MRSMIGVDCTTVLIHRFRDFLQFAVAPYRGAVVDSMQMLLQTTAVPDETYLPTLLMNSAYRYEQYSLKTVKNHRHYWS